MANASSVSPTLVHDADKQANLPSQIAMWIMRILVPLNGSNEFIYSYGYQNDNVAKAAGVVYNPDNGDFDKAAARRALNKHWKKIKDLPVKQEEPDVLAKNIRMFGEAIGLSPTENAILEFTYRMHTNHVLTTAVSLLDDSFTRLPEIIATILDLPPQSVIAALAPKEKLLAARLLLLDSHSYGFRGMIQPFSQMDIIQMLQPHESIMGLLTDSVKAAEPAELTLRDYDNLTERLEIISSHLSQALDKRARGVNVLVYGPPGTGKTQLARVLANQLQSECLEVVSCDSNGMSISPAGRLRSLTIAHEVFGQRRGLLVFDEMEDIIGTELSALLGNSPISGAKAWMNNLLETNPLPTIWLSNQIEHMDRAMLRRFDVILEVKPLTRAQRYQFLNDHCEDLLSEDWRKHLADIKELSPAIIKRTAAVVRGLPPPRNVADASKQMIALLMPALRLQGCVLPPLKTDTGASYRPDLINTEVDLQQIAEGIRQVGSGRILLYGPPGTGKTAYCRWLAEQLDRPLMLKQASDVLGAYVGQTEENLARLFKEASQTKAVLAIDEVDSFLADRREARHAWEVTAVNEFLVQMERFDGIFLASTNRLDNFDAAALRRFDLKAEFGFLRKDQRYALFMDIAAALQLEIEGRAAIQDALARLELLTPGDFAAIKRQARFNPVTSADDLLRALRCECEHKEGFSKRRIGF